MWHNKKADSEKNTDCKLMFAVYLVGDGRFEEENAVKGLSGRYDALKSEG